MGGQSIESQAGERLEAELAQELPPRRRGVKPDAGPARSLPGLEIVRIEHATRRERRCGRRLRARDDDVVDTPGLVVDILVEEPTEDQSRRRSRVRIAV